MSEPNEMLDETGDGIAMRRADGDVYIAFHTTAGNAAIVLGPEKQEEFAQLYVAACRAAAEGRPAANAEVVARAVTPGQVSGA